MIHRIRIQNYRSIRDVTVELTPVTVLVGRSGTGKSNFVNAMGFLRDCLGQGAKVALRQIPFTQILPATQPKSQMRFTVEFSVPGFAKEFVYDLAFGQQGPQGPLVRESLAFGGEMLFEQVLSQGKVRWDSEPELVNAPQPGPLALGRLPGLEKVVVAFASLTTGIGIYHFHDKVLTGGQANSSLPGLSDNGQNYLDIVQDITTSLQDINTRRCIAAALAKVNPTVVSVELDSIQNPTTAVVGHTLGDKILTLQLKTESDGFRRFYAHLLALYQSPPKQTLIFEEPENGIYPGALSLLADEFKAAADSGRGQVILTTHSPRLLDHFEADQIRVVELIDLETRIGPLAEEQREAIEEELLHTGELLTTDPARLKGAGT